MPFAIDFTDLPDDILDEDARRKKALAWATQERAIAAKGWADAAHEETWDMLSRYPTVYQELTKSPAYSAPEEQKPPEWSPSIPEPRLPALGITPFGPARFLPPWSPELTKPERDVEAEQAIREGRPAETLEEAAGRITSTPLINFEEGKLPSFPLAGEFLGTGPAKFALRQAEAQVPIGPAEIPEYVGGFGGFGKALAAKVEAGVSRGVALSPEETRVRKMLLEPQEIPPERTTPGRWERIRRDFVRAITDENVDVNIVVADVQKELGRPLSSDERVDEILRINTPLAAKQIATDVLRPALQAVRSVIGDEGPLLLRQLLLYQDNVDKAAAVGRTVAAETAAAALERARRAAAPFGEPVTAAAELAAQTAGTVAGEKVRLARRFSGDIGVTESVDLTEALQRRLNRQEWDTLWGSAEAVWGYTRDVLWRKFQAGILPEALYNYLQDKFPHYVPSTVLDYVVPEGARVGGAGAKKFGLSDRDLHRLTIEGSAADRADPIASAIEAADRAEAAIKRNRAFTGVLSLAEQVPSAFPGLRQVPADYTAKSGRGEQIISGFVNGEARRYVVPFDLGEMVERSGSGAGSNPVLVAWQGLMAAWRNLTTGSNPRFIGRNASLDAGAYLIRATSQEGGLASLPRVVGKLIEAYGETFAGLGEDIFKGEAAELLREGGGVFGVAQRTPAATAEFVAGLERRNPWEIRSLADIARVGKDILELRPVGAVGERVEMAPRVAARMLAKERGERSQEAMTRGRDITIDFQRAGTLVRSINTLVPFFNVNVQKGAYVPRLVAENPKGAAVALGSFVALPTLMFELWNRADPDRSRAYDDVPDYIKQRSIVAMLPFTPGEDERGNPRPPFLEVPMREFMLVAAPLRNATARMMGSDREGMDELALTMLANMTPLQVASFGAATLGLLPGPVGTVVEAGLGKSAYRGRDIATERSDELASELSQIAAREIGGRASYWEYIARGLVPAYANLALPASSLIAEQAGARPQRQTGAVQDIPVAGGILRGVVGLGAETGQLLVDSREARYLPADLRRQLKQDGIEHVPGPIARLYEGAIPLSRAEQVKAQDMSNERIVRELQALVRNPVWQRMTVDQKEDEIRAKVRDIHRQVAENILGSVPISTRQQRMATERRLQEQSLQRRHVEPPLQGPPAPVGLR